MTGRPLLAAGAALGGLAVVAGAFGAHALGPGRAADLFGTASRYQMAHALALLLLAQAPVRGMIGRAADVAASLFLVGVLLFSGSLYMLGLGAPGWFGAITPLGGASFIAGWALIAAGALRRDRS